MPRLIFKCPYIKGGTKSTAEHLGNYVKYMATRNGVERIDPGRSEWPATEKQTAMVEQILRDFPISKEMFEYADYLAAPTRGNASDFITRALEDNYDQTAKRENYLKYIAREVVGAAVVSSELLGEVIEGVETVTGVKALLVLAVAVRHLAVVARRVGPDALADTQLGGGGLKQSGQIALAVGKTVGELKSIVSLDTLHADAPASMPLEQLFQEIGGGIGGLLRVGGQEAQAGKLVNGSILVQAQFRVCDTASGDHPHIHLDPLAGISHLLVRLWFVGGSLFRLWEQPQLPHRTEQAFRAAGVGLV